MYGGPFAPLMIISVTITAKIVGFILSGILNFIVRQAEKTQAEEQDRIAREKRQTQFAAQNKRKAAKRALKKLIREKEITERKAKVLKDWLGDIERQKQHRETAGQKPSLKLVKSDKSNR